MALERGQLHVISGRADRAPAFVGSSNNASRDAARQFLDGIHPSIGREFGLRRQAADQPNHLIPLVAQWLLAASDGSQPMEASQLEPVRGDARTIDFAAQRRSLQTMFPLDDTIVFFIGHYRTPTGKEGYTLSCHKLYEGLDFLYAGELVASERAERMPGGEWVSRRPLYEFQGRHQIEMIASQQAEWARGYQIVVHSGPRWQHPGGEQMPIERAA